MKREVGEFMTKSSIQVWKVGSENDRTDSGQGHRRSPGRSAPPGDLRQSSRIRDDHQPERGELAVPEARPAVRPVRRFAQAHRQSHLGAPGDDRHPTDLYLERLLL